jgi:hypothetical protein
MPTQHSVAQLREAFRSGAESGFTSVRSKRSRETFYGYNLCFGDSFTCVWARLCSEEFLAKEVRRELSDDWSYLRELRYARWFVGSWYLAADKHLKKATAMLRDRFDEKPLSEKAWNERSRTVLDVAAAALGDLDKSGFFGRGKPRERVVLMVSSLDQWDKQVLEYVEALNPKKTYKEFRAEYPNWEGRKQGRWDALPGSAYTLLGDLMTRKQGAASGRVSRRTS